MTKTSGDEYYELYIVNTFMKLGQNNSKNFTGALETV